MIRTQISFDEEQYAKLQARARAEGVSMAALVRDAVDAKLGAEDQVRRRVVRRALSVIGIARGGQAANVSEDHDRYLDEAYGEW